MRRFSARPDVLFADFRGQDSVAFDLVTRKAYAVNPSARLVIGILLRGRTAGDAASAVTETFGIQVDAARADVARAIRDLEAAGLLSPAAQERAAAHNRVGTRNGAEHGR